MRDPQKLTTHFMYLDQYLT